MRNEKVRMLVEMALAVAIALTFSQIKLFQMPQGGSVTLEMLPIIFISLRWGVGAGVLAGTAHGLLQMLFGAWIVHFIQVVFDYPLPFALLGLAGLFKTKMGSDKAPLRIIMGSLVAVVARFISHFISGVVFWGSTIPEGQNPYIYSAIYNVSYLIPAAILTIVILLVIRKPLAQLDRD